jgi:hypothetical protein
MNQIKVHNGIRNGPERYEEWREEFSPHGQLRVKMWRAGNKVRKFSVVYIRKLKGRWIVIRRYDNSHQQRPHCHIYGFRKGQIDVQELTGEANAILTESIQKIKKSRKELTEFYFRN